MEGGVDRHLSEPRFNLETARLRRHRPPDPWGTMASMSSGLGLRCALPHHVLDPGLNPGPLSPFPRDHSRRLSAWSRAQFVQTDCQIMRVQVYSRHGTRCCCSCCPASCCCGSRNARCSCCCSTRRRAARGSSYSDQGRQQTSASNIALHPSCLSTSSAKSQFEAWFA